MTTVLTEYIHMLVLQIIYPWILNITLYGTKRKLVPIHLLVNYFVTATVSTD